MVYKGLIRLSCPGWLGYEIDISKLDGRYYKVFSASVLICHDLAGRFTPCIFYFSAHALWQCFVPFKIFIYRQESYISGLDNFLKLTGCPCTHIPAFNEQIDELTTIWNTAVSYIVSCSLHVFQQQGKA